MTCTGGANVSGKMADSLTPKYAASTASYKFTSFFKGSTGLKDASGLDLDGIAIAYGCYISMFKGCTSLTQAPALPATTLATSCYNSMFYGCTSLTQAPALPATTLASNCYNSMFRDCTKVTELHYSASMQNNSTFTGMTGSPWFGATNATVHYDL